MVAKQNGNASMVIGATPPPRQLEQWSSCIDEGGNVDHIKQLYEDMVFL